MYSYFTDLHVDLLAQALLQPGEQRVGQTVGRYVPWWAFGFVNETYLVIATDRRLILVEHKMAWLHQATKLTSVESLPWAGIQETRVTGLFGKSLRVQGRGQNREFSRKMRIPNPLFGLLAPMRRNLDGARAVSRAYQIARGLPAAPAYPSLAPAPYAQTPSPGQYSQLAPQPTQPSTPYAAEVPPFPPPAPLPVIPQVNAPGYTSVPPTTSASASPKSPSVRPGIPPTPPRFTTPRMPE